MEKPQDRFLPRIRRRERSTRRGHCARILKPRFTKEQGAPMTQRTLFASKLSCLLCLVGLISPRIAQGATCESLTGLKLENTTITLAQTVAAGAFAPPAGPRGRGGPGPQANPYRDLPAFC